MSDTETSTLRSAPQQINQHITNTVPVASHSLQEAEPTKPVIVVEGLVKQYRLYNSPRERLWSLITGRSTAQSHWAINGVSFALHRGQCLGLVGNNGAGKSTLLKLLTGSLQPSAGSISVDGRLTAILELGAGFHPEFSGRDNLYFGGSLIGLDAARITELLPSITDFAELAHALDRPVKTYSSGMVVRLAFALITAVEPDVLIIDEALAVGDQTFQKKCVERIEAFKRNGCTILFCSHSLYHVRHLCDVALWMDKGEAKAFGDTEMVLMQYELHVREQENKALGIAGVPVRDSAAWVGHRDASEPMASGAAGQVQDGVADVSAQLETENVSPPSAQAVDAVAVDAAMDHAVQSPAPTHSASVQRAEIVACQVPHLSTDAVPLLQSPDLSVTVTARVQDAQPPHIGVMLEQLVGTGITAVTTHADGVTVLRNAEGLWQSTVTFTDLPLASGDYVLSVYLFDASGLVVYDEWLKCQVVRVLYPNRLPGLVRLPHVWR